MGCRRCISAPRRRRRSRRRWPSSPSCRNRGPRRRPRRVDAEYAQYADRLAADSATQAQAVHRRRSDPDLEVSFHKYAHRSAPGGLLQAVDELTAEVLVLGSAADGKPRQVVIGSTADRLLHSSPVPLAIGPRGYRGSKIAWADPDHVRYPGTPESGSRGGTGRGAGASNSASRCGSSPSPCAVARCIRPRSDCAPRTPSSRPGPSHCARSLGGS